MRNNRFLLTTSLFAVLGLTAMSLVIGCGGGGGGGGTEPPTSSITITNVAVSPTTFPDEIGGEVTITANATATAGISTVQAIVTKPDHTTVTRTMTLSSGSTYRGTYVAPENTNVGVENNQTYSVVVKVTDTTAATRTSSAVTFVVPAVQAPPPPGD